MAEQTSTSFGNLGPNRTIAQKIEEQFAALSPAAKYAVHLAAWRRRRNESYSLKSLMRRERYRSADRMFDLTHFERRSMEAHGRLGRWG